MTKNSNQGGGPALKSAAKQTKADFLHMVTLWKVADNLQVLVPKALQQPLHQRTPHKQTAQLM